MRCAYPVLKYDDLNDIQGAFIDFNKAIDIDPSDADFHFNRGLLKYNGMNDIQGAFIDFNKAIDIDQQYANAYYWRGTLKNCRLNDASGAIKDFRQSACLYMEEGKTDDFEKAIAQLKELGANAYSFPHKMKK